ncbi:UNVERIFIED_CONTAM: CBL-interacting protein kinase [Sesamum calycinum]|uniref:non-specific serine/threonine protein kinase n=1 Tax=Sesamum calycinum TaxID=2727403 RepID=A0AAW2RPR7_9LAMI
MKKYEVGRLLGKGTFAKVYYGKNLQTGESVAIKVIDKEKVLKVGLINQTKREIAVMRLIKHQNVMQLHEVMATKTKIYFVIEFAKGGELFNKVKKGKLKENTARKYFQQLISAVSFCHNRGVYHRDLKPENLLLDENGSLKVSDFGLSALSDSKRQDGLLHTTCGTPAYVAPEVIGRKGYDGAKADIWSCGVILFVLLTGYLPFHDPNLIEMYRKISRAEYKCPPWLSPQKGYDSKATRIKTGDNEIPHTDIDSVSSHSSPDIAAETKVELARPASLNAFDIISLSTGFDLSGFFVRKDQKDEVRFTSSKSTSAIISKLEEIASRLRLSVKKKDDSSMRLEGSDEGWNWTLSIDVEIFEIASSFHVVEVKKSSGDTLDYQNMLRQDIRPALGEIICAWEGEQQEQ